VAALAIMPPMLVMTWFLSDDRPQRRLPDGSLLRLTTVRYGSAGDILYGPAWKRRLYPLAPLLPVNFSQHIGWEGIGFDNILPPGSLLLGLEHVTRAPHMPTGRVVDRHGCRYGPMDNHSNATSEGVANLSVFPFFPRRETSFRFETYCHETEKPIPTGEFEIANPLGTRHPNWSAERLPLTRSSGPLTVTLQQVTCGWSYADRTRPARGEDASQVRLDFHLSERARDWRFVGATLSDASGASYRFTHGWERARGAAYIPGDNLCREEPAYEYRLEFSRALSAGAPPDRFDNLGTVVLGDGSRPESRSLSDGRKVTLYSDAPSGSIYGNWMPAYGQIGRLIAVDAHGLSIKTTDELTLPGGMPHGQQLGLTLPRGTQRARVRFEIYSSRYVTFRIKPRWISDRDYKPLSSGPTRK
jgi:hypothetical protein